MMNTNYLAIGNKKNTYKIYTNLDKIPIYNFHNAINKDIRYILILDDYETLPEITSDLVPFMSDLIYQLGYINIEYQKLRSHLYKNEILSLLNPHELKYKTQIAYYQKEIENYIEKNSNTESNDFDTNVAQLEKWLQQPIDIFKMSAKRYFAHQQNYIKQQTKDNG